MLEVGSGSVHSLDTVWCSQKPTHGWFEERFIYALLCTKLNRKKGLTKQCKIKTDQTHLELAKFFYVSQMGSKAHIQPKSQSHFTTMQNLQQYAQPLISIQYEYTHTHTFINILNCVIKDTGCLCPREDRGH